MEDGKPFLAVVWFHAPHEDIEAGPEYLKRYEGHGEGAHFYGCITELDEQVGRIRTTLQTLGVAENTLIFFCSDNGPEGKEAKGRRMGTTNGLRGRKRDLYDGGVRVPALAVWPGKIAPGTRSDAILSTLDYFPTIATIADYEMPDSRPIDGEDILPILTGKTDQRTKSIPFRYSRGNSSLVKGKYKFMLPSGELYDLSNDWAEEINLADSKPEMARQMKSELVATFRSIEKSHAGADYNDPSYQPVDRWRPLKTEPEDDY